MAKVGRPPNHTPEEIAEFVLRFEQYVAETDIPIICEFAYLNDISRDELYDRPEFSAVRKKAIAKKEAQLERMGLSGEVDKTMAIFSLKQLGWSDRQQVEHSGGLSIRIVHDPALDGES